jgi:hypothetical protein
MAWGDEQVIVNDEVYIYYGGYERGHKVERFKERHIGFASMPVDRYVSREADFNGGYLITKPVKLNGSSITVNANVVGELSIRLLDSDKKPLPGFDWFDIKGDSTSHKIEWGNSLESIAGRVVCLEFRLKDAQLFGFNLK